MFRFFVAIVSLFFCFLPPLSFAQMGEPVLQITNDLEAYKPDTALASHSNGLMGETISMDTGEISFSATDVSLPGNSNLAVEIRRVSTAGIRDGNHDMLDWRIDIPRIQVNTFSPTLTSGNYGGGTVSLSGSPKWPNTRCTGDPRPGSLTVTRGAPLAGIRTVKSMNSSKFFGGLRLQGVPGSDKMQKADSANAVNYGTISPKWVTKSFWKFTCLSSVSGGTGQGYLGYAPDGSIYKFNVLRYEEKYQPYSWPIQFPDMGPSHRAVLYVSEVTDVHGNWVKYEYNSDGLTRIHANDGREITLTYGVANGGVGSSAPSRKRVFTVSANGRTWSYDYNITNNWAEGLTKVTLPDGRKWEYDLNYYVQSDYNYIDFETECVQDEASYYDRVHTVKHPDGTIGEFKERADLVFNGYKDAIGSSNAPWEDFDNCTGLHSELPFGAYTSAIEEKKLTLSDGTINIWTYAYEELPGNYYSEGGGHPSVTKKRTIIGPTGNKTVHHVNRQAWAPHSALQGTIVKTEIFETATATTPIKTTTKDFAFNDNFGGSSYGAFGENTEVSVIALLPDKITINRDGDAYTTEFDYNANAANSSFSFANPIETKTYSTVSGSTAHRVTDVEYEHNTAKWILGQTKKVTTNGREISRFTYNTDGQKTHAYDYNALSAQYFYYSDGTPYYIQDANGNRTYAYSWKRGTPQRIRKYGGNPFVDINTYQYVDNNGWVTSTKDGKGQTTTYTRDNMGRLTLINPPGSWANTSIAYNFAGGGAVQTITKGQSKTTITYDSMFRPTLERSQALDTGWSSYVKTSYDGHGRATFKSFPSTSSNPAQGTNMTYDGLGRIKSSAENVSPYATTTTNYYSGNRRRVTDPTGKWTDFYYYGYDMGAKESPRGIYEYANGTYLRHTYMYRDVHSQMYRLRQWGNYNGYSSEQSQYLYYDSQQRLCRLRTLEGGDTLYAYDSGGRVTAYSKGHANGSSCAAPSGSSKVSMTYDGANRLRNTNFTDGNTPDIAQTYDNNSNILTKNRGTGSSAVNWTYAYNDINLPTSETLTLDSKTFAIGYLYNNSGDMTRQTLPGGAQINYTPDGLGRAKTIKRGTVNLATSINYHASGSVSGLNYGNGHVFSQTLTPRLQPLRMQSYKGGTKALDLTYSYDNRGFVTAITDQAVSGQNKSFGYDGLARLTSASGPWGSGSFKYDPLGNVRQKVLGTRTINMSYNSKNQLSSYTDSAGPNKTLGYDSRGNVSTLGTLAFTYDMADQPRANSYGTFVYDGNLKRAKAYQLSGTIYNVYDSSGSLVHVDNVSTNKKTDYVSGPNGMLARVTNGVVSYLHNDHLGTSVSGTTTSGAVAWREDTSPFGITSNNPAANDNLAGFTGHIKDKATGLNYMQARYYDPVIGRFLSIDPVDFMLTGNPAHFNRYAYANNDPVNLVDLFGLCATDADGNKTGVCGTDQASQDLLDRTKQNSPETAEADALAEFAGVHVPFTHDPNSTGGSVDGSSTCEPCSATVGGAGSAIDAVDTRTGENIPYSNSPEELTAHEVGGHVRDRLLGKRDGQIGDRDAFTPNSEVNAIASENNYRQNAGIPVSRNNYSKTAPMIVTATRGGGPSGVLIYNRSNLPEVP